MRTVLELRPTALAFQAEKMPEGSVWNRAGLPSEVKPAMRVEMPKGLTPPLWVNFCCTPAMRTGQPIKVLAHVGQHG